jgi:hypothetical protein
MAESVLTLALASVPAAASSSGCNNSDYAQPQCMAAAALKKGTAACMQQYPLL